MPFFHFSPNLSPASTSFLLRSLFSLPSPCHLATFCSLPPLFSYFLLSFLFFLPFLHFSPLPIAPAKCLPINVMLSYPLHALPFKSSRAFITTMKATGNFSEINVLDKILGEQDRIIWESIGLTPDIQSMENAALLTKVIKWSSVARQQQNVYNNHELNCWLFLCPFYFANVFDFRICN